MFFHRQRSGLPGPEHTPVLHLRLSHRYCQEELREKMAVLWMLMGEQVIVRFLLRLEFQLVLKFCFHASKASFVTERHLIAP